MLQSTKTAVEIINAAREKFNESDTNFVNNTTMLAWLNEWYIATLEQYRPNLATEEITLVAKTYEYAFTTTSYLLIDSAEYRKYDSDGDLYETLPLVQASYKDISYVEDDFGPKYFYERTYSSTTVKIGVFPYLDVVSTDMPEKVMVSFVPYSGELTINSTMPLPMIYDKRAVYYLQACFYQRDNKDQLAEKYMKMSGIS
jgi:hypothetical protein